MTHLGSTDLTTLMTQPIKPSRGYFLSVDPRVEIFSGQINGTPTKDAVTGGWTDFLYDHVLTGAYTDVEADMSVDFGTTLGGRDIGTTRVRRKAATSSRLYIAESAPGDLALADNIYFSVKREWTPRLIKPRGVGKKVGVDYTNELKLYMDYDLAYSDQNEKISPKANITRSSSLRFAPKPAGFVDNFYTASPGTYRTMTLSAVFSFAFSGSIVQVAWDIQDGSFIVGTLSSTNITVTFPVGFRWIRLEVLDSNGKYGIMYWPIWVHDATHMPISQFIRSRDNTQDWREIDLEFNRHPTSEAYIPRGTTLCYWKEPYFTIQQYRSHMLGWCKEDTTIFRKTMPRTKMTIMGAGGWMNSYRGFPIRVSDPGRAPATWFEMSDITLDGLAFYILENITTLTRIANYYPSDQLDDLKSLDITQGNIWQQLNFILSGYHGRIKADSLNALWSARYYVFLTDTAKAGVDTVISLNSDHWTDADPPAIVRTFTHSIGHILAGGASFDTTNHLYGSYAPGVVPADFDGDQTGLFQTLPVVGAQAELNRLNGIDYEYQNDSRKSIGLKLLQDLDILEPAWNEPVLLSSTDSISGRTMVNEAFMVTGVDITYGDPATERETQIQWTIEGVSGEGSASDVDTETDPVSPVDSLPPGDIIIPPVVIPATAPIPGDTGLLPISGFVLAAGSAQAGLADSFDPATNTINYHEISTGLTGNGNWACSDPFNYFRHFALMDTGVYRCDDVTVSSPTWTLVKNNAALFGNSSYVGHKIIANHQRRGWFMILCGENMALVTLDYFTTTHLVNLNGLSNSFSTSFAGLYSTCDASIAPHNASHVWAIAPSNVGAYMALYKSTDFGLTWAKVVDLDATGGTVDGYIFETGRQFIELAYNRRGGSANLDDSSVEITWSATGDVHRTHPFTVYAIITGLGVPITIQDGSDTGDLNLQLAHPTTTFTNDGNYIWFTQGQFLRRTTDGLVTMTGFLYNSGNGSEGLVNLNGWPSNRDAVILFSRQSSGVGVKMCVDGVTFFGNAPAFFTNPATAYAEYNLYDVIPARG